MEAQARSRGRRRLLVAALALVALAAIAVGVLALTHSGPFADDDGEPEQLSKQEFLARGDEICKSAREQYVDAQGQPIQTATEAADLTANLVEISQQELDEIRGLNPPPQLEKPLDAYLQAREQGIQLLEQAQQAAEDNDPKAYQQAQQEVQSEQLKRTKLAEAVGFTECSRPLMAEDVGG